MQEFKPSYGPVEGQTGSGLETQTTETAELPVAAVPETTLSQCALGMTDCPGMEEVDGEEVCFFRKLEDSARTVKIADRCETAAAINVQL